MLAVLLGVWVSFSLCMLMFDLPLPPGPKDLALILPVLLFLPLATLLLREPLYLLLGMFALQFLLLFDAAVLLVALGIIAIVLLHPHGCTPYLPGRKDENFLALAALLPLLGIINAADKIVALTSYLTTILIPMTLYYALLRSRLAPADLARRVAQSLVIAFAVLGLGSLYYKLSHPHAERVAGFVFGSFTMYGYGTAAVIPLAFYRFLHEKRKLLWGTCLVLVTIAMLLTNTRMALISTGVGLLFFGKQLWRIALPAVLLGAGVLFLSPVDFFTRFDTLSTVQVDFSSMARLVAWISCWDLIGAHPLLGIGFGDFAQEYLEITRFPFVHLIHAHNVLLNKVLEIGIPAALVFLSYIAFPVIRSLRREILRWRKPASLHRAFLASLIVFLMAGATDSIFYWPSWSCWFWMLFACLRMTEGDPEEAPLPASAPSAELHPPQAQGSSF